MQCSSERVYGCSDYFMSDALVVVESQSKIPLGLVIQAMALDIDQKDGGLEVVNFGAQVRCGAVGMLLLTIVVLILGYSVQFSSVEK